MALYKRANSKYWWMAFDFNGSRIQQSTKLKNKRDAADFERLYRAQLNLGNIGIAPKKSAPTFKSAATDFLEVARLDQKPTTFARYAFACDVLIKFFGSVKVDQLKIEDIEKFKVWRSKQKSRKTGKPISPGTINNEMVILKMIFKRLLKSKVLTSSPTADVQPLKEGEPQFYVVSYPEQKKYLMAAPQPLTDVASLMFELGLRPSEIFALTRADIDLKNGWLQIQKGKTKAARRRLPLTQTAREILAFRMVNQTDDNLFTQLRNPQQRLLEVNRLHLETIKRCNFKFRLYDARHTFASRTLEAGCDLLTLASILGHANTKTVQRYAHPSEAHKFEAIYRMERNAKAV
jgi:integrase